eukprot:Nitzschia sp. Nitz4//scaffold79_size90958//2751//3644//NITZ4_005006-RA/size90958-processed-gene-0.102-mRNA-1//-1//CDS//3329558192//6648//frame0
MVLLTRSSSVFLRSLAIRRSVASPKWLSSVSEPQILMKHLADDKDPNRIVTQLTLNRPKANAMGSVMLDELQKCLDELEDESQKSRVVVVTSCSDKVYSAGADLKERREMSMEQAEAFVCLLRNTMQRAADLPQPVIAAIEGVAVGGGLELALACDIRIASSKATLGLPETSLAIIPGAGGTQRLPRLVGTARAKELIWTGRRLSGEEAEKIGLVDQVVEPGTATNTALELAWKIASNGPIAIRASKSAIDQGMTAPTMEEALAVERKNYALTLPTKDRLEGLAAFKEGRSPEYKGE